MFSNADKAHQGHNGAPAVRRSPHLISMTSLLSPDKTRSLTPLKNNIKCGARGGVVSEEPKNPCEEMRKEEEALRDVR